MAMLRLFSLFSLFQFGRCRLIEHGELVQIDEDLLAVGHAPFMQGISSEEETVESLKNAASLQEVDLETTAQSYYVHDDSDAPTGPQHGWISVANSYKDHVHIFNDHDDEEAPTCSDDGRSVHIPSRNHLNKQSIGPGAVLLIEACGTTSAAYFLDVHAMADYNHTHASYVTEPRSQVSTGELVEKREIFYHLPMEGNVKVTSLKEASSVLHRLRSNANEKMYLQRVKVKRTTGDVQFDESDTVPFKETLTLVATTFNATDTYEKAFNRDGKFAGGKYTMEAKVQGKYDVKFSFGTTLTGSVIYKNKEITNFEGELKGTVHGRLDLTVNGTASGKYLLDAVPARQFDVPVFSVSGLVNVALFVGGDIDVGVAVDGHINAKVVFTADGEMTVGAKVTQGEKADMSPMKGTLDIKPEYPTMSAAAKVESYIKATLEFGVQLNLISKKLAYAQASFAVSLKPTFNASAQQCDSDPEMEYSADLYLLCGAKVNLKAQAASLFTDSLKWEQNYQLFKEEFVLCQFLCNVGGFPCHRNLAAKNCSLKESQWAEARHRMWGATVGKFYTWKTGEPYVSSPAFYCNSQGKMCLELFGPDGKLKRQSCDDPALDAAASGFCKQKLTTDECSEWNDPKSPYQLTMSGGQKIYSVKPKGRSAAGSAYQLGANYFDYYE